MKPQASQLAELVKDWPEINHLYMIENFLRRLVPEQVTSLCDLSLTLTDTGDIMMVLEAVHDQQSGVCQAAAMEVTEKINTPSSDSALEPVVRTARLLGGLGGSMIQNSVQEQSDLITGDVAKMRADTTNKMAGTYNNQMKSVESYTNGGIATGAASVSTVLVAALTVTLSLL